MRHADSVYAARLTSHRSVAARLSRLSDSQAGEILASASAIGAGIGGRCAELDLGGTRIFVKRVPLTDIETRPSGVRSTANLFGLPLFYQYGVGSAGFGAWRELAAHTMTTSWVLTGEYEGFPLMYHWRVLPDSPPEGFADEFGGIDGAVAYWEGSPAVRARLEAIGRSSCSLVLFLEHIPQTLGEWLHGCPQTVPSADTDCSYSWVEAALARGTAFMRSRGLVHFDAHFRNLLTDGRLVYFADFGLALSSDFELAAAERQFLSDHLAYDRHYTAGHLVHSLVHRLPGGTDPDTLLREWIEGRRPDGVQPGIAAIIERHARTTVLLDKFHRRLLSETKWAPFPATELNSAAGMAR
ncbi:protein kinase family protein [Kitasatospora sp. NPDC094015]|uniref:protein kinase family protein n=1 Tax=Kitasatospora sp. NPDC094015 TaxID=3155205 RepID=UPI00333238C0